MTTLVDNDKEWMWMRRTAWFVLCLHIFCIP